MQFVWCGSRICWGMAAIMTLQALNAAGVRAVLRAHLESCGHLRLRPCSCFEIYVQLLKNGKV